MQREALNIPLLDIQRGGFAWPSRNSLAPGLLAEQCDSSQFLRPIETSGELGFGFNSVDGGGNGSEISGVFNVPIVEDELAMRASVNKSQVGLIIRPLANLMLMRQIERLFAQNSCTNRVKPSMPPFFG